MKKVESLFILKNKKFFLIGVFILSLLCFTILSVHGAQENDDQNPSLQDWNYRFEMPFMETNITVLEDGSIDIYYKMGIRASVNSDRIEVFDIGFPNFHYEMDSVRAKVNGTNISKLSIHKSEYIDVGVEIWLGQNTILPGNYAVLEVWCNNPVMVFEDQDEDKGSVVFRQTWFGQEFTYGSTERTVRYFFTEKLEEITSVVPRVAEMAPTYVTSEETPYLEFKKVASTPYDDDFYTGVAFPADYATIHNFFWKVEILGLVMILLPLVIFGGIFLAIMLLAILGSRREHKKYLPPTIRAYGGNAKTDLEPSEVALLQELPFNKVAGLMFFEMMKKGFVELKSDMPLRFNILIDKEMKKTLPEHEKLMLEGIRRREQEDLKIPHGHMSGTIPQEPINQEDVKKVLQKFIDNLNDKMKGFSAVRTRQHYQTVLEEAWEAMKQESPTMENAFLWIMLDKEYETRLEAEEGSYYYPGWYANNYYWATTGYAIGRRAGYSNNQQVPGSQLIQLPKGKVGGITGLLRHTNTKSITNHLKVREAIRNITRPAPSSSSGRSGSSCACACACACAGGGR